MTFFAWAVSFKRILCGFKAKPTNIASLIPSTITDMRAFVDGIRSLGIQVSGCSYCQSSKNAGAQRCKICRTTANPPDPLDERLVYVAELIQSQEDQDPVILAGSFAVTSSGRCLAFSCEASNKDFLPESFYEELSKRVSEVVRERVDEEIGQSGGAA